MTALAEVGMRAGDEPVDLRRQRAEDDEGPDPDRDAGDGQGRPELPPAEVPQESRAHRSFSWRAVDHHTCRG